MQELDVSALIMRLLRMRRELFIQGKYVSLWGERGAGVENANLKEAGEG